MPDRSTVEPSGGVGSTEALVSRAPTNLAAGSVGSSRDAATRARDGEPGLGRSIAVAAAVSMAVVLAAVTGVLVATGAPVVTSLGIGAFAALWGGGGFGAMIGGVLYAQRVEEPVSRPSLVGSDLDRTPALLAPWPSTTPVPGRR
ncbi:MAG TPA: hypothetical protein VNQ33_08955 [Acidimicrobiales bacterium]|nr:hypothetical protein [Acidimicrobiales bacterium]